MFCRLCGLKCILVERIPGQVDLFNEEKKGTP